MPRKHPVAFIILLGKILPLRVSGVDGRPLEPRWVSHEEALKELG
jgi:hypothetical protein